MQNDIIPQRTGTQRGAIRPPIRVAVEPIVRVQPRDAIRPVRSIDGMTAPMTAPRAAPAGGTVTPGVVAIEPQAPLTSQPTPEAAVSREEPVKKRVAEPKARRKLFDVKRWGLIGTAVVVLGLTSYVSLDTWLANTKVSNELNATAKADGGGTWTTDQEGQDETKIPKSSLANYAVAADLPRALYIDKLNIAARILPMSVNTVGSIQAPLNINDSGWYSGSVKPGETGAVFIDGHASGPTREGLFAYLDTLKEGDTLQVEKGDSTKLTYKVVHTEVVPLADLDMKKVLLPYQNVNRGLNIMTCTGKWLPREKTYDHRVVVYTQQI